MAELISFGKTHKQGANKMKENETKKNEAEGALRNMVAQFPAPVMEWLEAEAESTGRSRVRYLEYVITTLFKADMAKKRRAAAMGGAKKGGMVALLMLNPVTVALAVVGATALLMAAFGMGPEF